jgi:hypothetical protein
MDAKGKEINEVVKQVQQLLKNIKEKKASNSVKREELRRKEEAIRRMLAEKQALEETNSKLREKYENAARINRGESNVIPDFKIEESEVINFIPSSPIDGIKKIKEELNDLKNILKSQHSFHKTEKKEMPYVSVKYHGQNIRYLIPEIPNYTFKNLLEDTCAVFGIDSWKDFYFKDNSNCVWPLCPPVLDYLSHSDKELQLLLTKKNLTSKKKDETEIMDERERGQTLDQKINKIFKDKEMNQNDETSDIVESEGDEKKKNMLQKLNREREIILMIEKTFGQKICSLILYLFFMVFIFVFIIKKSAVLIPLQLVQVLNSEFYSNEFMVNFTIFDYLTKDSRGSLNNYSYYQVQTSLKEMKDVTLIKPWLTDIYFPKLEFLEEGRSLFMQRHRIVGPIRFFQVRQEKNPNCTAISQTSSQHEINSFYCYGQYKTPATVSDFPFYNKKFISEKYQKFEENCTSTNYTFSSACNIFRDGFTSRKNNLSYIFTGQNAKYDLSSGFYFDLDPITINENLTEEDLNNLAHYIAFTWIDLSTRLFTVTFNAYQSSDEDNSLFSVTLHIEIGASQIMVKSFDVQRFNLFINFKMLLENIRKDGFLGFIEFAKKYIAEIIYLILLCIYSVSIIKTQLAIFKEKKQGIIYNGFFEFVFHLIIGGSIMTVLVLRLIFIFEQIVKIKTFRENMFIEFFSVNYFSSFESAVTTFEILMVFLLCVNSLTVFYVEFFEKVFLTFKYSLKYLLSLFLVFFFILVAYASCCTLVYGWFIIGN